MSATCEAPLLAALYPWEYPAKPWSTVHMDYPRPLMGKLCLLVVDAFSKWMDSYMVQTATSKATIEKLQDVIVSDNGSCFTSAEFESFCSQRGITHTKSTPCHPATNGLAERAVQSFERGMKKLNKGTLEERLQTFLMGYRNTPHSTTERTLQKCCWDGDPK